MKPYVKVYLDYFGHGEWLPCEVCNATAVDVHHIEARKRGGSDDKDVIENLMALCRKCHLEYGDKKQYMDKLKELHLKFMTTM